MLKNICSAALLALVVGGAAAATPRTPSSKPVVKAVGFGLTESLAVLMACPDARFESANVIALGAVLLEHKPEIDATPFDRRLDLMNQLVASETAKSTAYAKSHKMDCALDPEKGAAYWNRTIARIAANQPDAAAGNVATPTSTAPAAARAARAPVAGGSVQLP